jgi:uncharacterized protein YvpB
MVAVARPQQIADAQTPLRSPLPEHLLQPKKSPIAQRLAQQEAERLAKAKLIARQRTVVDQNLRQVDDRPLIESARPAGRPCEASGIIDAYVRRTHQVRRRRQEPTALIGEPVRIGRSTQQHFDAIHAGTRPSMRRMRMGRIGNGWHLNFAGRMAIASLAAVIVVLGAFGTGFAQQRYEVQEGDTLASVAETFGVDPAAIASSSYMPNGDALEAGQVIIIPDVGQAPEDAAAMAAELEGTSPWVVSAHWVEWGDTLDSIGATYGVTGAQLAEFNGIEDATNVMPGTRILIPVVPAGDQQAAVIEPEPDVVVANVPTYQQSRNLSCEFAATHIATATFGNAIPEDVLIDQTPITLNPHYGYRGNIDGSWGNTDDYGIYPEALVPTLESYGFVGETFYSEGDTGQLTAHIDAGQPVVVWLALWGDTRVQLDDQGTYSVAAGMHVMTVYGYSDEGVFLSDPATGGTKFYDWGTFTAMWSVLDGMSMAVYPA